MTEHVFIAGPASWNRIVLLDHLPEPVPHMQFALGEYETLGATSAGKALGLVGLGRPSPTRPSALPAEVAPSVSYSSSANCMCGTGSGRRSSSTMRFHEAGPAMKT